VLAHLPFGLVLGVVAVGLLRIVMYHWRDGTVLIGAALFLAAALRAVLSNEQAGLILIRTRGVDVLTYSAFGAGMIFVAMTIEGGPLGN
jgi:Protein of unknown function (DUF3017)